MILVFKIGFLEIGWLDVLDVLAVSVLLYQLYKLMKGSIASKVFLGFIFLYLIYLIVKAVQMELLSSILGQFMGVGVLAIIILFSPEIRKFLLMLGKSTPFGKENTLFRHFLWKKGYSGQKFDYTPVIEASRTLSGTSTGALIIFSKESELKFYVDSGDRLDALINKRLLISIFNKNSPLHDGAVIIHKERILAARCILPVSDRDNLPAQFGLRHRAAIGMSETTDTLVLVVSEETGQISMVRKGEMYHNLSLPEIRKMINEYLEEEKPLPVETKFQKILKDAIPPVVEEMEASNEETDKTTAVK